MSRPKARQRFVFVFVPFFPHHCYLRPPLFSRRGSSTSRRLCRQVFTDVEGKVAKHSEDVLATLATL